MSSEDTIDIREQDQRLRIHHLRDESRQFIVIGKHQFGDAHRVVLIDDRQHIVFEHHLHTCLLVLVLFSRFKVFLHGQHLSDMDIKFPKEVVIESDEFDLSHSRKQLSLFYRVEQMIDLDFSASTRHSTRRHENNLMVVLS